MYNYKNILIFMQKMLELLDKSYYNQKHLNNKQNEEERI